MVKGVEGMTYEEWLRILSLFRLQKRSLRGDCIAVYNFFMKGSGEEGAELFALVSGSKTRGNGLKLRQEY